MSSTVGAGPDHGGPDSRLFDRYLARIGVPGPVPPDESTLTELARRHQLAVPFENLGVHAGEDLSLEATALLTRIVDRGHGGICYELNGAFSLLLAHLGFRVRLLPARVWTPQGWGLPYGHVAVVVDLDQPWLVDVGFADDTLSPIPLRGPEHGDRLWRTGTGQRPGDLLVLRRDQVRYAVREGEATTELADFEALFWWHRTSPRSRFTRSLVCSLPVGQGRCTLSGRRLTTTGPDGRRETVLADDEVLDTYRDLFGIHLAEVPTLRERQPA